MDRVSPGERDVHSVSDVDCMWSADVCSSLQYGGAEG